MGCEKWGSALTDWALDELSPTEAQRLEQHLASCMDCGRVAARLRELRQALKSNLTERAMPAHLVLAVEKPQSVFAGFWPALVRASVLAAASAAVFLGIVWWGFWHWAGRGMPTAALDPWVARAVAAQASVQEKQVQAATQQMAESLRQEEMKDFARIAQQLQYLELAQNTVWREAQEQDKVIRLVARTRLQSDDSPPATPARR